MGRQRRRIPWGSLVLGLLCLVVAIWAVVAIPGAAGSDRGSFVATPARVVMPDTPAPATPTPVPQVTKTPTPQR
jgi:hypothetical protein